LLRRAELGVSHIEEVRPADETGELIQVGMWVRSSEMLRPSPGRRSARPVGRDGEDEQQLFEVGPEVLVVTMADRRGRLAAAARPSAEV